MALGLIETDKLIRSAAAGVGNVLVLFGAKTGRDGIGGASVLASAELDESEDKRPSVQVGDPFAENKLMECSLELLDLGLLVALQDLGAAGLTSSSAEMAAKGEVGLDMDVRKVPVREQGMEPFEIMISESQERMLCVVEPARVDEVLAVCARWEVDGTAIGTVTDTRRLRVFDGEELVGDLPVIALVDECPAYDLEPAEPATPLYPAPTATLTARRPGRGPARAALLGQPRLAQVGLRAVRLRRRLAHGPPPRGRGRCRAPAARDARDRRHRALRRAPREGPRPAIAVAIDGNGRRVAADPYRGAVEAVLECSANLACVGAEPLGLTNCLNFGNPEKPHIAWQLTRAIAGLGDACRAFGIPVVGGNVSLYNEGGEGPIYPTPVVGLVGELPDARRAGRLGFARPGDAIALIAADSWAPSAAASELSKLRGEPVAGPLPAPDLGEIKALHAAIRQAVRAGTLSSAHDVAEGGVAVALAEAALAGGLGATVTGLDDLFGEGPGAFIVSGPAAAMAAFGAAARVIGEVGGDALTIDGALSVALVDLERAHTGGLRDLMH